VAKNRMKHARVTGVEREVSQIIMGTLFAKDIDEAAPVFDYFLEQGGNCFDTASWFSANGCSVKAFATKRL